MKTTTIPAADAATSTAMVAHWISADGQGSFNMSGATAVEALTELLGECTDDEQRAGILAGRFTLASDDVDAE